MSRVPCRRRRRARSCGTAEQSSKRLHDHAAAGVARILLQDLSVNPDMIAEYGDLARRLDGH